MEAGPSTSLATTRSRLARYASAAAALLVVVLGAFWMVNRRASSSSARNLVVAVAVLPFIDLSSLKDQEYFSDGITEELITTLSQIEGMHVPSRTSTFAFKGKGTDIKEVGRALAASHIVEGSVRREGERFRISVQLVNVADGYHLWAETYDGDTKDVFAIQTTIARTVAEKLRGKLVSTAPAVASSPAAEVHPEAYDLYMKGRHSLYLKGRYAWYRRSEDGLRTAASYFQQAVNVAPRYARAHAGLADAYAVLGFYDYLPPREAFTTAERAATQALTLDSALGGPHATLGYVNLYYHWDWPRAEAAFQRAIAVDPTYSTAHQWYANLLTAMGRFDDAEREMRRAQELDPLSLIANAALGWVFYFAGDYEQSIAQCRQTLELDPEYALAVIWSGWSMEALGRTPEAIAQYRRAISLTSGSALSVASLARALAASGDRAQATVQLKELEARGARGQYVPAYELAKIHTALGNRDRAFEWLARAYEQRSHSLVFLQVDPQLKSLRGDPRFRRLVGDVGLVAATR